MPTSDGLSALGYAFLSLVGLAIGIGLLNYYVDRVPALVQNGVENRVFYILLIPSGIPRRHWKAADRGRGGADGRDDRARSSPRPAKCEPPSKLLLTSEQARLHLCVLSENPPVNLVESDFLSEIHRNPYPHAAWRIRPGSHSSAFHPSRASPSRSSTGSRRGVALPRNKEHHGYCHQLSCVVPLKEEAAGKPGDRR